MVGFFLVPEGGGGEVVGAGAEVFEVLDFDFQGMLEADGVGGVPAVHEIVAVIVHEMAAVGVGEVTPETPAGAVFVLGAGGVDHDLAVDGEEGDAFAPPVGVFGVYVKYVADVLAVASYIEDGVSGVDDVFAAALGGGDEAVERLGAVLDGVASEPDAWRRLFSPAYFWSRS